MTNKVTRRTVYEKNNREISVMLRRSLSTKSFVKQIETLYKARNPNYQEIVDKLKCKSIVVRSFETEVQKALPNDHMALRTLSMPSHGLGLNYLDRFFQQMMYLPRDEYVFAEKKLRARWYAPSTYLGRTDSGAPLPRIFVSELCVDQLSQSSQTIFQRYLSRQSAISRYFAEQDTEDKEKTFVDAVDAIDEKLYDQVPSFSDYELLRKETEYGAWTLLNGHRINHLTISTSLFRHPFQKLCFFVPHARQYLNVPIVGNIQTSEDQKLHQISTEPIKGEFLFSDQQTTKAVNGSFIEFIERIDGRDGFEAKNANRIFETTNRV